MMGWHDEDPLLRWACERLRRPDAGRNNTLFRVGVALLRYQQAGGLPHHPLDDWLTEWGLALGLGRREVRQVMRSAARAAAVRPWVDGRRRSLPRAAPFRMRRPGTAPPSVAAPPPPSPSSAAAASPQAWQQAAAAFVAYAQDRLWDDPQETALTYLTAVRALTELTVVNGGLGWNPQRLVRSRARWGLPPTDAGDDALVIPSGIVIPYRAGAAIVKIEVRGLDGRKYTVPGSANVLWHADYVTSRRPALLVEGVINGLTVRQEADDLVVPVALGAATHARRPHAIAALARAPLLLVATDAGRAGDAAATYWLHLFPDTAVRWRPYVDDPNAMHRAGLDVRAWVQAGLASARRS